MINKDIQIKFKEVNGMEINDAIKHIEQWISEKNYKSAENGITELEKFINGTDELKHLNSSILKAKTIETEGNKESLNKESEKSEEENTFTKEEKFLASLSYIWFLAILPLVLGKDSKLCTHHGKQGLIFAILFFFVGGIANFLPFIGGIVDGFVWIMMIGLAIFGGMKASKGIFWKAPLAGDLVGKINLGTDSK